MNELLQRLRREANALGYGRQFDDIVAQYPQDANGSSRAVAGRFEVLMAWDPADFGDAEDVARLIRETAEANGFHGVNVVVA